MIFLAFPRNPLPQGGLQNLSKNKTNLSGSSTRLARAEEKVPPSKLFDRGHDESGTINTTNLPASIKQIHR